MELCRDRDQSLLYAIISYHLIGVDKIGYRKDTGRFGLCNDRLGDFNYGWNDRSGN